MFLMNLLFPLSNRYLFPCFLSFLNVHVDLGIHFALATLKESCSKVFTLNKTLKTII